MSFNVHLDYLLTQAHSFGIDVNDHKALYRPIADYLAKDKLDNGRTRYLNDEQRATCIRLDRLVLVQVYPDTPIGFFCVASHDVHVAVAEAYELLRRHRESGAIQAGEVEPEATKPE